VTHRHSSGDDDTLVRRCLDDDPEAWRELVERHRTGMIELARRILPTAAAVDVVDAVIADLWQRRKLARYQGRSSLRTWLGAVVLNASLNARRALPPPDPADARFDGPHAAAPAVSTTEERELASILHDAIARLAPELKTIVLLYYEQGLTLDELTVVAGGSKSTLSRTLRHARRQILDNAQQLARDRGTTLDALRHGIDLGQLDLDLRAACAAARDTRGPRVSNS